MTKKTTNKKSSKYVVPVVVCVLAIIGLAYYYLFSPMSKMDETVYVCIDDDDNADSVFAKVQGIASKHGIAAFRTMYRALRGDNRRRRSFGVPQDEERHADTAQPHHPFCTDDGQAGSRAG